MLRLDRLTFHHAGSPQGYSFDMEATGGEITAVEGRSGAGKSTLLDLVAGFLRPESGNVLVSGSVVTNLPPEQRPVSILFQSETLFDHLSAARNVALGQPGLQPGAPAVDEALKAVGLGGIGPQRAATLSGGQKQRVALARTLLRNRPVLLLDEPFSALDDETRGDVRMLVQRLTRERGWATLLVTHHRDDIAAIADRVYRLEDGVLQRDR